MLESKLYGLIGDYDDETVIEFNQWTSTDRANLISCHDNVPQFTNLVIQQLEKLTAHSFIAKCQSNYLRESKENLEANEVIILGDFAENYSFVLRDEVLGFHWNLLQCTLQPVVVYYKDGDALQSVSYCIITDDNKHDFGMVYQVQKEIITDLKLHFPTLVMLLIFLMGVQANIKTVKIYATNATTSLTTTQMLNGCFFATRQGKQPCDGIGGTVKQLVSNASLQCIMDSQILNPHDVSVLQKNIQGIKFIFITKDELTKTRKSLENRFTKAITIPGTRSYHEFIPLSEKPLL